MVNTEHMRQLTSFRKLVQGLPNRDELLKQIVELEHEVLTGGAIDTELKIGALLTHIDASTTNMSMRDRLKLIGLTVRDVTALTGVSYNTLKNWTINKPRLFEVFYEGLRSFSDRR